MAYTLSKTVIIRGVGIHSGEPVVMTIEPSNGPGIIFQYNNSQITVNIESIGINNIRATSLTNNIETIHTPEHFLAACFSLELTNILVTLSAPEVPILDGSAIGFIDAMQLHRVAIDDIRNKLIIKEKIKFNDAGSSYIAMPSDTFSIEATISYPDHWINTMTFQYQHSMDRFTIDIAPARTYGFIEEIEYLKKNNLAKGGSLDNALVITDDGYLNEPRFENEMVRHKILDFIGDISIYRSKIQGHFIINKPSHQSNTAFAKYLYTQNI